MAKDETRLTCPNGHPLFGHITGGRCGVCGEAYTEAKGYPAEEDQLVLETKEHGRVVVPGPERGADASPAAGPPLPAWPT